MINFRFHLVSLIAVFLALGLGVLMGATVIDQAIVDGLNDRIESVRRDAEREADLNRDLNDEVDRLEEFLDASAAYSVAGRLDGVPVAVVALRDVSGDDAGDTVELLQTAGAIAPGVLWLEEKWALGEAETRAELAAILGIPRSNTARMQEAGLLALTERLKAGTATPEAETDLLADLAAAGFVTYEPVGDQDSDADLATYPGVSPTAVPARAILIDGTDATIEMNALVAATAAASVALELPLTVGEVYRDEDGGPNRGSRLAAVREDDEMRDRVSTVDDLERGEGRVTLVLALADLGRGAVGHYGSGGNVDSRTLPELSSQ